MGGIAEIVLLILSCGVLGAIVVCFIGEAVLTRRYNKFYETTKEGKMLYCALYTKNHLGSRKDWLVNQMCELRDKIDEFESYFPDECYEKIFLMKVRYKGYFEELERTKEAMKDWRKRIEKMVAVLLKRYKGILEYNWELAKVEVKEEGICW